MKQYGVDDAEDCAICSNAEGKRDNYNSGEPGIFAEHAQAEAGVLEDGVQPREATAIAIGFFCLIEAAEFDEGLTASFFGRHACAEIVVDVELEMGFEFGSEITVAAPSIENISKAQQPSPNRSHECLLKRTPDTFGLSVETARG
jgi:hypothetical protein